MPIVYKLTDRMHQTRGETQWGPGVTHEVEWSGEMCSNGCLHGYRSIELAILMNPVHANIQLPVGWKARTPKILKDDGVKIGMSKMTTLKTIPIPMPTTEQYVEFAIRTSLLVDQNKKYVKWAKAWLSNKDRSAYEAEAAARAAASAAACAAYAAAYAAYAAKAAKAAAYAAKAAAYAAACAAYAAKAVKAAAYAATNTDKRVSNKINRIAKRVLKG